MGRVSGLWVVGDGRGLAGVAGTGALSRPGRWARGAPGRARARVLLRPRLPRQAHRRRAGLRVPQAMEEGALDTRHGRTRHRPHNGPLIHTILTRPTKKTHPRRCPHHLGPRHAGNPGAYLGLSGATARQVAQERAKWCSGGRASQCSAGSRAKRRQRIAHAAPPQPRAQRTGTRQYGLGRVAPRRPQSVVTRVRTSPAPKALSSPSRRSALMAPAPGPLWRTRKVWPASCVSIFDTVKPLRW